jgi:hypothetical protein
MDRPPAVPSGTGVPDLLLFAGIAWEFGDACACGPVDGVVACGYVAMEARPRPIARPRDMAVLDGVEMDVVEVRFEIGFIANRMFPKAALPDTAAAFERLREGTLLFRSAA